MGGNYLLSSACPTTVAPGLLHDEAFLPIVLLSGAGGLGWKVGGLKVILGGPPRSGKSCLREGLSEELKFQHWNGLCPYPTIITACPDGEGSWFSQAASIDPVMANDLKRRYRSDFTPEFVDVWAANVRNSPDGLTIIDIGGRVSPENEKICAAANSAVLVAADLNDLDVWREFCSLLGLQIVAELRSDHTGTEDHVQPIGADGVLRGSVHGLKRGLPLNNRPAIKALANHLIARVTDKP